MVASVALFPDNTNEAKHVESRLLPRLDEGSTPSSSTINTQLYAQECVDCVFFCCYHVKG